MKHKELNLKRNFKFFPTERNIVKWILINLIVTDKPDFNCFEYKPENSRIILSETVFINWKFEYKHNL